MLLDAGEHELVDAGDVVEHPGGLADAVPPAGGDVVVDDQCRTAVLEVTCVVATRQIAESVALLRPRLDSIRTAPRPARLIGLRARRELQRAAAGGAPDPPPGRPARSRRDPGEFQLGLLAERH